MSLKTSCPKTTTNDEIHAEVERYIHSVLSGEIIACKYVKLACRRHLDDLAHGAERNIFFDPAAARKVIKFFKFLRHSKGKWAGQVIALEPWQKTLLWILFGWKNANGKRRFRTAYVDMARKQGKSTLGAGIGLYLMVADGEHGAEIYSAATKRDQARITHQEAVRMVKKSPDLNKRITAFRDNLHVRDTATKFEPLGRDADSMDGLNVHGAIIDELHAHPDDSTWGVLETATGAREQPLLFGITTAGFNHGGFCYQLRDYAIKVLEGAIEDDAFFATIYTLDDPEEWRDETMWIKSNPNLDVSVNRDTLRSQAAKAVQIASHRTNFMTKAMNVWTTASENWVNIEKWRLCGGNFREEDLMGRECYAGLDLSSALDLTAIAYVFPPIPGDDKYRVIARFWAPEATINDDERNVRVPYRGWQLDGYLISIPGETIDYEFVWKTIEEDAKKFKIKQVGFDRWGSQSTYLALEKAGIESVAVGQGFTSMSAPMKELERLIVGEKLRHGDNPVLTWMAHNVVASVDAAGNIKPDKAKSRLKIDGIVAMVMALDGAMRKAEKKESIYKTRGIRII